jgi:hypothetical protein
MLAAFPEFEPVVLGFTKAQIDEVKFQLYYGVCTIIDILPRLHVQAKLLAPLFKSEMMIVNSNIKNARSIPPTILKKSLTAASSSSSRHLASPCIASSVLIQDTIWSSVQVPDEDCRREADDMPEVSDPDAPPGLHRQLRSAQAAASGTDCCCE